MSLTPTGSVTGGSSMGLTFAVLAVLGAGLAFGGCGDLRAPINRVGTTVVEKSAFEGSWYMTEQIIDFDYEASSLGFVGEISSDNTSGGYAMTRIRWVIDQETLYAFRDYQTVADARDPTSLPGDDFLGQPIAAYAITSHFDIRRSYNTVTGEEQNVIEENSVDRRWWERRFMRVNWSRNLLSGWYGTSTELSELFGSVRREATDVFVQSEANFRPEWRPHFYYMSCADESDTNCSPNDRLWARDYEQNDFYAFDFVTQQLWSPNGPYCGDSGLYPGAPECASVLVSIRTGFLRVSDQRDYDAQQWDDELFDRAGYFRLERDTFDGSTEAGDPSFGLTDYRNVATFRHNIWTDWTDEATGAPIPYADRDVRRVVWHTSRELPAHLVRPAYETVSEWNVVLMGVVRERQGGAANQPVYMDQECQRTDPGGYCYCETGPGPDDMHGTGDDVTLNPTCAGRYDPFEPPDAARARLVSGEPFDCYVAALDAAGNPVGSANAVEPDVSTPDAAASLSESDFTGWFNTAMTGSECVVELRLNTCNLGAVAANGGTIDGLECQERGDIRFSLLSYVDQAGTPFLGVAQFRADPVTGELLGADANIGGPALQTYRTRALQAYDLISGRLTDQEFFTGEDIRAYLEAAGRIDLPAPPRIDFSVALEAGLTTDPAVSAEITNRLDSALARVERLELDTPDARAHVFDRLEMLAGTDIERRLVSGTEGYVMAGLNALDPGMTEAEMIDLASPFRGSLEDTLLRSVEFETRLSALGVHMPNEYTDDSVLWYVNRAVAAGWTRAQVEFDINRRLYRQTEIHELGHCMGLRHDFAGSADTGNYAPDYYRITEAMPLPDPNLYDVDSNGTLDYDETRAYETEYSLVRRNRELSGIDAWMTSSIMDYTANWYERIQGSGRHDWMAVALGYGDLVDVYHRGPISPASALEFNPANTPREYATYYRGGETCTAATVATDCPYSAGGAMAGDLTPVNLAANLVQTCVAHPTRTGASVCSNFDDDAAAMLDTLAPTAEYVPVSYRYCEDYRSATRSLPYCNTFDEGDSYREMVRNAAEGYERSYIFGAFRRYRRTFSIGGYINGLLRYMWPLINIQAGMLYRWQSDPGFRDEHGPWGFEDQFLATADSINFFARILASPGIGSYSYDRIFDWYERSSSDPDEAGANLRVRLGAGRFFQSVYQSGLTGIYRIERIGSVFDKIITMQLMTIRGLSPFYGPDVVFQTNLYDLFPVEMNQLFTGMIADQASEYMPRVECGSGTFPACEDPRVVYMDFYRGDCLTPGSTTCRPNPDIAYDRPELNVLNGGDSFLLQSYAAIFGLAEFPVYYDTTFDSQMFLCVEGSGDCSDPAGVEGTDYARHTSIRYGQSYLAWQLDPSGRGDASIAFAMVNEAARLGLIVQSLKELRGDFSAVPFDEANIRNRAALDATGYVIPRDALGGIDRVLVGQQIRAFEGRVNGLESFFNYLIQIEREFGINFPILYRRPEL